MSHIFCYQHPSRSIFLTSMTMFFSAAMLFSAPNAAEAQVTGTPLGSGFIELLDGNGNLVDFALTAADGTFTMQNFGPGSYSVRASHVAIQPVVVGGVVFLPGDELILSGTLTTDGLFLDIEEEEPDSDGDGTPDSSDGCPIDPNKIAAGQCGCGVADTDSDGDGVADCNDECVGDPAKTTAGSCGCGVADTDSDGDGTADCNDECVDDPAKTTAGSCGCGVPDSDADGDGVADCLDNCPSEPNPGQEDQDGNGTGDACELHATICSTLGRGNGRPRHDKDIFTISGAAGETLRLSLEAVGDSGQAGRATLLLVDRIRRVRLLEIDSSALPNVIETTLPADGKYLVVIATQPGWVWSWRKWRFVRRNSYRGEYCLSASSSGNAYQTLNATRWVE